LDGNGGVDMYYPIVVHKDKKSDFGAAVPDLPGCFSSGKTLDEVIENAKEAIICHIEGLLLDGDPIGQPTSIENYKDSPDFKEGTWAVVNVDLSEISGKAKRVNITIPERFLKQFDSFAHKKGESRSGLFVSAAMEYMSNHPTE
jgi:predicted RNase H-like HicB family nuclease